MNSPSRTFCSSPSRGNIEIQTFDERTAKVAALEQEEENEFTGEEEDSVVTRGKEKVTNTEKAETGKIEQMKNLFIDIVNPKFKNFNRPVTLAFAVGLATLASFIALFVYLQTDCESQSMTTATPLVSQFFEENDVSCVHWAVKMVIIDGKQEFPPCRMVSMDYSTGEVTGFSVPVCEDSQFPDYESQLSSLEPCTASTTVEVNHSQGGVDACLKECWKCQDSKDYCLWAFDASQEKNFDTFNCDEACAASPDGESQGEIEMVTYEAPAMMVVEFDLCPDPVLTLGSAFGWVAMIELATTLVILAVAMPLGYIKNDQSTWKVLISEVTSEENKRTIQSGATDYVLEM